MKERAPTYAEILETARRATEEIQRDWPAWMQALSKPERSASSEDVRRHEDKPQK